MGKDRTGKLDSMLGVNDKDLKTPIHDEICLWVDKNYKNIIVEKIIPNRDRFLKNIVLNEIIQEGSTTNGIICENLKTDDHYTPMCQKLNKKCVINEEGINKKCPYYKSINKQYDESVKIINDATLENLFNITFLWEEPIKSPSNGFIVGIPDFTIVMKEKHIKLKGICKYDRGMMKPIKIFIEVKPKVKSIGETMRQLKLYRSYMYDRDFENYILLVSQSNNLDVFESQGIKTFIVNDNNLEVR